MQIEYVDSPVVPELNWMLITSSLVDNSAPGTPLPSRSNMVLKSLPDISCSSSIAPNPFAPSFVLSTMNTPLRDGHAGSASSPCPELAREGRRVLRIGIVKCLR